MDIGVEKALECVTILRAKTEEISLPYYKPLLIKQLWSVF